MLYPWKDKIASHKFVTWKQPFCSKSSHEDDLKRKMRADSPVGVTPLRLRWRWKDACLIGLPPTETVLKGSDLDWLKPQGSTSRGGVRAENLHFSQETLLWLILGDLSLKAAVFGSLQHKYFCRHKYLAIMARFATLFAVEECHLSLKTSYELFILYCPPANSLEGTKTRLNFEWIWIKE